MFWLGGKLWAPSQAGFCLPASMRRAPSLGATLAMSSSSVSAHCITVLLPAAHQQFALILCKSILRLRLEPFFMDGTQQQSCLEYCLELV